jgi:hypothetical protein
VHVSDPRAEPMMVRGQYDEPTATMTTHLKDLEIIGKFAADPHCRRRSSPLRHGFTARVLRKAEGATTPGRYA